MTTETVEYYKAKTLELTAQLDLYQRKLWKAIRILEHIADEPPTLMHDANHHEVLVYSPEHNPARMARQCLIDIEGQRRTTYAPV